MRKRILSKHLNELATKYPVLTITGPRQSGKTTLCRATFPNYDYVTFEEIDRREQASLDPRGFLEQFKKGVILDEIQRAPSLVSYIQGVVDRDNIPGRFVLTGSQQFEVTNHINQSLAGRTAVLRLLPFSIEEAYGVDVPDVFEVIHRGFYPRIYDANLEPTQALSSYVSTYVERDIRTLAAIRDLSTFERFLKLCAANVGQLLNYSRLASDCGIDQKTVKYWLSLLEASYIIFQINPHFQNLRKRLTKMSKLYFYDVGLAAFFLGIRTAEHVSVHHMRGALFENLVIADILKQRLHNAQTNNLFFFRDHVGKEVDLLLDEQPWVIPIEIKLGNTFNKEFLVGLDSYKKLNPEGVKKSYLLYGGNQGFDVGDTCVKSWKDFGTGFSFKD